MYEIVDLHELARALPDAEEGRHWSVSEDDVADVGVVVRAAEKITHGPSVFINRVDEYSHEIVVAPEGDEAEVPEGVYRLVPIDPETFMPESAYKGAAVGIEASIGGLFTDEPDIGKKETILETVFENWDFDGPFPRPIMPLKCLCGNTDWHPRYWLFHDYSMQTKAQPHRFRYRCDVSMKCTKCSFVGVWGVIVPDEWWAKWNMRPQKVTWQDAARVLKSLQEQPQE